MPGTERAPGWLLPWPLGSRASASWLGFGVHLTNSLCFRTPACWASSQTPSTPQSHFSGPATKPSKPCPVNNRISCSTKTTRTSWRSTWSSTWSEMPRYSVFTQTGMASLPSRWSNPGTVFTSQSPWCWEVWASPAPAVSSSDWLWGTDHKSIAHLVLFLPRHCFISPNLNQYSKASFPPSTADQLPPFPSSQGKVSLDDNSQVSPRWTLSPPIPEFLGKGRIHPAVTSCWLVYWSTVIREAGSCRNMAALAKTLSLWILLQDPVSPQEWDI